MVKLRPSKPVKTRWLSGVQTGSKAAVVRSVSWRSVREVAGAKAVVSFSDPDAEATAGGSPTVLRMSATQMFWALKRPVLSGWVLVKTR